jgi:hypothetical protein
MANVGLVVLGFFLIVIGLGTGSELALILGVIFLIPGIATGRRRTPAPSTRVPQRPPPPRYTSPKPPAPVMQPSQMALAEPKTPVIQYSPLPAKTDSGATLFQPFSSPLFPTAMLPTLNLSGARQEPQKEAVAVASSGQRDELLELLALMGVVRILSEKR